MLKSNGPNSISKDALRDEDYPWLINCTTQEYLVNVGQDSTWYQSPKAFMSHPDLFASATHQTNPFLSQYFNFFAKPITQISIWSQAQKNPVFLIILHIRTRLHAPPTTLENSSRASSAAGTTKLQICLFRHHFQKLTEP
jgi:hypothetical protein